MTDATVRDEVRRFIQDNFLYMRQDYRLQDDDPLLAKGVIDSLGVGEIIAFVEQRFGVRFPDEDITEANLGSVSAIVRYVRAVPGGGS
jgi:acyl carrier protein